MFTLFLLWCYPRTPINMRQSKMMLKEKGRKKHKFLYSDSWSSFLVNLMSHSQTSFNSTVFNQRANYINNPYQFSVFSFLSLSLLLFCAWKYTQQNTLIENGDKLSANKFLFRSTPTLYLAFYFGNILHIDKQVYRLLPYTKRKREGNLK